MATEVGTEKGGNTHSGPVGLRAASCLLFLGVTWAMEKDKCLCTGGLERKAPCHVHPANSWQTRRGPELLHGTLSASSPSCNRYTHLPFKEVRFFWSERGCDQEWRWGGSWHEHGALGPKCRPRQMSLVAIVSEGFYKHNLIVLPQTLEAYCPA